MASVNGRGDKLHPCLVPQLVGKLFDLSPLFRTAARGLAYKTLIHLIKSSPRPNVFKVENK